jgi:Rieske Fe-S protein
MADDDKYPESSGRRRFVKGVVGSAALAGVGTATAGIVNTTTQPTGTGGGTTTYFGVENTEGPAPRAMPQVPVEIDGEGYIKGVYPDISTEMQQGREVQIARMELGGITYEVDWYQYCGIQGYEGLSPNYEGDNYFRYANSSGYTWQQEEVSAGDRVNVEDLADYQEWGNEIGKSGVGKPAAVTWRSQDTTATIPVMILRSERVRELADAAEDEAGEWLAASTDRGVMAVLNKCTHFCCVPGFKSTAQSVKFGAADEIFCPCHQSVYDPFSIVKRSFVAYPRPEGE